MKKTAIIFLLIILTLLSSCGKQEYMIEEKEEPMGNTFIQITQEDAKKIMDDETGYIILDVREQEEYDTSHIPGAILMPYTRAEELAEDLLPDKDQQILVYCRTGRRSKIAAQTLSDLGYTNIKEFGGILDWPYEVEYIQEETREL